MSETVQLRAGELRSLRAYARADPLIPIAQDRRMFERLRRLGLVIGSVGYGRTGEPFGAIKLTARGQEILQQTNGLPA